VITALIVAVVVLLVLGATAAAASLRVLREYERAVVFRLGRLMEQRGPGIVTIVPGIDRMVRISLRTITLTVPPQEVITRDNVPVRVTAVAYYRVVEPNRAVVEVSELRGRDVADRPDHAAVRARPAPISTPSGRAGASQRRSPARHRHPHGALGYQGERGSRSRNVEIPERMQHAIARQAEAERERRAKIINAEGEFQAAEKLSQAADVISQNPVTIQLR